MLDQITEDAIKAGAIVKCSPWGEGQGDFVLVNAADFDPAIHTLLDDTPKPRGRPKKDAA
jgi:hypothetical protein